MIYNLSYHTRILSISFNQLKKLIWLQLCDNSLLPCNSSILLKSVSSYHTAEGLDQSR